eukprot:COSAG01_NODE_498_length_16259_cov_11.917512_26_plen_238_part_00
MTQRPGGTARGQEEFAVWAVAVLAAALFVAADVLPGTGVALEQRTLLSAGTLLSVAAAPLGHCWAGYCCRGGGSSYRLWQPLQGGQTFVAMQSAGWTVFAVALLVKLVLLLNPAVRGHVPSVPSRQQRAHRGVGGGAVLGCRQKRARARALVGRCGRASQARAGRWASARTRCCCARCVLLRSPPHATAPPSSPAHVAQAVDALCRWLRLWCGWRLGGGWRKLHRHLVASMASVFVS